MIDEIALVEELQNIQTKEKAFRILIKEYKERLYWHIRKIVLDHHDSDDVLQNTFIKIYRNIAKFKGDSKLYTWMYRIATNESLTFVKRKSKQMGVKSSEYIEKTAQNLRADPYFDGNDIALKLQKAIGSLPEKQRLVFQMKYQESMKYKDISAILGTSVGALKTSYHHAVKKIKEKITTRQTF